MWMELTPLKMICSICAEFGRHSIDGVNSPYSTLPHFCVGNLALTEFLCRQFGFDRMGGVNSA